MHDENNPYDAPSKESQASDAFSSGVGHSDYAVPMGILSICVAIVGVFWICCCGLMIIPTSAAAIVTGAIAVNICPPHDQTAKLLGIVGIALGALELVGFAGLFIVNLAMQM